MEFDPEEYECRAKPGSSHSMKTPTWGSRQPSRCEWCHDTYAEIERLWTQGAGNARRRAERAAEALAVTLGPFSVGKLSPAGQAIIRQAREGFEIPNTTPEETEHLRKWDPAFQATRGA